MKILRTKNPLVSIIISIYQPELSLLEKSLKSLVNQTYEPTEIIIINDGLKESDLLFIKDLLAPYKNIIYINNQTNLGLTKSLNKGIQASNGDLIARQDADDISKITRIEKQVDHFKKNNELGLLGTWYSVKFQENTVLYRPKGDKKELINNMFERNPFCHSSVMIRRSCIERVGEYSEKYRTTQDLELWFRIGEVFDIGIMEDILVERNLGNHAISYGKKRWIQLLNSLFIRLSARKRFTYIEKAIPKIIKSFLLGFIFNLSPKTTNKLQGIYRDHIKKTN